MTKIRIFILGLILLRFSSSAQDTCASVLISDTLHYYFNKYYFKTGNHDYASYPVYKSPAATATSITHVGCMFENVGQITVTGLEAFAGKPDSTASTKIPVHLYLCAMDQNNMPLFPPLDSVETEVNSYHKNKPGIIGGDLKHGPRTLTGNFAVLFRNMSVVSGDTVWLLRTAGLTQTYVATPAGWTSEFKYSDDRHAFIRFRDTLYNTRDFSLAPGFGFGTEYEFMIAPRVRYKAQAGHKMSENLLDWKDVTNHTDTACARSSVFSFTNVSSPHYTSRFFNLNEFYRRWNLYYAFAANPLAAGGWSPDSAITWNFEFREQENLPSMDGRVFLSYGLGIIQQTISTSTGLSGCWTNQFRASLRPMGAFGRKAQIQCSANFSICTKFCSDGVGVDRRSISETTLFPNPLTDGRAAIKNLEGYSTLRLFNLVGEELWTGETDRNEMIADLAEIPRGTYLLVIYREGERYKVVKLIK